MENKQKKIVFSKSLNMTPEQKLIRRYQFEMHQRMIKRRSYWSFEYWRDKGRFLHNKYEIEINFK